MDARDQQRIDVLGRWRDSALTAAEAAALLAWSERTAWRLLRRLRTDGVDGIVHGNRGRASPRRLPSTTRERTSSLPGPGTAGSTTATWPSSWPTRTRRAPKYRSRRERMPQAGLLVQVDASPHDWLEGRGPRLTLVGAIDDATSTIVGATFAPVEDGRAYLTILARMCRDHGVPAAIYRDRSSIFAPSHPGGPLGDAGAQVGRALAELGIASIAAASPQAKGRVERLWGTCQDRLVSELRLAGADGLDSANVVLERFVGRFNARFSVAAANPTPAWRTAPPARELDRICAFRWPRVVGNDNTVRVEGAILQLPPTIGGRGLTGRRVEVELRLNGQLLVVDRGRTLLVLPVSPDLHELRGVRLVAEHGPRAAAGGAERPGYPPRPGHPWNRPVPKAPSRQQLPGSLSR